MNTIQFPSRAARSAWETGYTDYGHGVDARPDTYPLNLSAVREPNWYVRGYQTAWDGHVPENPLFGALPYQHMDDGPRTIANIAELTAHVRLWKSRHVRPDVL